jgi:hypothetical protein
MVSLNEHGERMHTTLDGQQRTGTFVVRATPHAFGGSPPLEIRLKCWVELANVMQPRDGFCHRRSLPGLGIGRCQPCDVAQVLG